MATIIYKDKGGRKYAYWVRSARVDGKPRIVEQVYLGPKERFLEEVKASYTEGKRPGPCPLSKVKSKEFGATAYLWSRARELGLVEIVDRHVPPPERRRTGLSVGQYLVIAAINRCLAPKSKRALYEGWYKESVLSRLWKARETELTSQRFWDHMEQVEPAHIEQIQHDVMARLAEEYPLGEDTILYDATNFFTFIDTFNGRTELAQRGDNKQKRRDLRQLSLALFEDRETGLPLYHQVYPGNRHDAKEFPFAWEGFLAAWLEALERRPEQLTLVFDRGNTSAKNLWALDEEAIHYVCGVPCGWLPELLEVERAAYRKLSLPGTKHVKAYRTRRKLWGRERTVLVVFSPNLYCKQRAAMNREQQKVEDKLRELATQVDAWREKRVGRGYTESSVRQKIKSWTSREHLRDFLDVALEVEGKNVVRLDWAWDLGKKQAVQRRHLGKQVLVTDQDSWDDVAIVKAYRRLARTERLFAISKSQPGLWWPLNHWTDSKIRVHALYCFLALLLLAILQRELRQAGLQVSVDGALDRLQGMRETLVVYTEGADRVVEDMDGPQQRLAQVLGLFDLAKEVGTTVLPNI